MTESAVPRRFAVLGKRQSPTAGGLDAQWNSLLRKSDVHEIVAVVIAESARVPSCEDWRMLLTDENVDAILVNDDLPETLDAARELAARGKTLVVPIRAALPADFIAELSLFDSEGETTLIPLLDSRYEPLQQELGRLVRSGRLGTLSGIEIEREVARDDEILRDPDLRKVRLLADVDVLRMLGGDYSQVTFIRTGAEDQATSEILKLAGAALPDATSTLRIAADQPLWNLRVVGSKSVAMIRATSSGSILEVDGQQISRGNTGKIDPSRLLQMIDETFRGDPGAAQWEDVARAFEIIEAAERSLRRRRTVDLHFETTSERSQFKTHMATIGCGVLVYTMLGVMGLLFAGAVFDPRDHMQKQAETAGFVIRAEEFEPGAAGLTPSGKAHLAEVAQRMALSEAVVLVESLEQEATAALDARRLAVVRSTLAEMGEDEANTRTHSRPLRGEWFSTVLQITRVIVFAPVGLYLLFQLLLVVAKPPVESSRT